MSCVLIGWLKTKKSIHWLIHVVEGISVNSPVLPCVAGSFCVISFLVRIYTDSRRSNEKTMGERAREGEREGKSAPSPLTPSPNVFRSDLVSAFARLHLLLCEPQKTASYAGCACCIKSLARDVISDASFVSCRLYCPTIGTLRSHDGDGNENFKKAIGLISKTTILHVHNAFLYIFAVTTRLRRENT